VLAVKEVPAPLMLTKATCPSCDRSSPSVLGRIGRRLVFVIGLVVLAYLYARHPERLPEMKRVFADDVLPSADEPVTSGGAS